MPFYSYLIVYRAERQPVAVVAVVHGRRDVQRLLAERFY